MNTYIHVCPSTQFPLRRVMLCPTCKATRRFGVLDTGPWYGHIATCCACGDSWSDGERLTRPFRRGWRTEAIARARKIWDDAARYTQQDWEEWVHSHL